MPLCLVISPMFFTSTTVPLVFCFFDSLGSCACDADLGSCDWGGGALLRNGPPHPTATQVPRGWHTGSWGSELKGVCTALLALAKRRESKKVVGAFEVTRLATPHHHSARPAPRTPDLATPTGVRECVHTAPTSHMHLIRYSFYGFTAVWQLSRSRSQRDGRPECLLRIRYSISSGMRHADGR